ncbi:hypothetical protein [Tautonia marina]|uniref:hypothetical protein n=1 Tax=Tautonia marina TaxID=2653855 RepID=UPI00191BDA61|nr:hypothetical protein [Tautonia marina]
MADNYSQATVEPDLPGELFTESELDALSAACGLVARPVGGGKLYFFADLYFLVDGEDEDGYTFDCLEFLQGKLNSLDQEAYPAITIHGASTCSKMRPGEFGGFAHIITRDHIRSFNTWEWLDEEARLPGDAHQLDAFFAAREEVAFRWHVDDVLCVRPDLTREQAFQVLKLARTCHDATVGINWEVLEATAQHLFGDKPEPEGQEA